MVWHYVKKCIMLKLYLKTAIRLIRKNVSNTIINVIGLSIGITFALIIFLYIKHEIGYDRFNKNIDSVYRVYYKMTTPNGNESYQTNSFIPLANLLKENLPYIEKAGRWGMLYNKRITYENNLVSESNPGYVDSDMLEILDLDFISGADKDLMNDPNTVILTQSLANKIFKNENALGKELKIDNEYFVTVVAVVKDNPSNSSFKFDLLLPFKNYFGFNNLDPGNWGGNPIETYVFFKNQNNLKLVEKAFTNLVLENAPVPKEISIEFFVQKLSDIHLKSVNGGGLLKTFILLGLITFFVLIIACINFVNLTTAKVLNRTKEIGIKKVLGAKRIDLIRQFFIEIIILSFFAFTNSIVFVELLLKPFNRFLNNSITIDYSDFTIILGFIFIFLFTVLFSGIYPALYFSAFNPQQILKGGFNIKNKGILRKSLVIFQFFIATVLLVVSYTINKQINYSINADLGYDQKNVVRINLPTENTSEKYDIFKTELLKSPDVLYVTSGVQDPTWITSSVMNSQWDGKKNDDRLVLNWECVNTDYLEVMSIPLIQGRSFSDEYDNDSITSYILNEKALKQMELKDPIGKRFSMFDNEGIIVGVVKDFHFESMHNNIKPLVLKLDKEWKKRAYIKLNNNKPKTIAFIKSTWEKIFPEEDYSMMFLEDLNKYNYTKELKLSKLILYAAILSIVISFLGLIGLSLYLIEKKLKEIAIRKILGSSVYQIILKLFVEFSKSIVIASIIAWPICYILLNKLLAQNYAYHISLKWFELVIILIFFLLISIIIIAYKSIKAANTNPAEIIRYE